MVSSGQISSSFCVCSGWTSVAAWPGWQPPYASGTERSPPPAAAYDPLPSSSRLRAASSEPRTYCATKITQQ